jgi:hypothetical protein
MTLTFTIPSPHEDPTLWTYVAMAAIGALVYGITLWATGLNPVVPSKGRDCLLAIGFTVALYASVGVAFHVAIAQPRIKRRLTPPSS